MEINFILFVFVWLPRSLRKQDPVVCAAPLGLKLCCVCAQQVYTDWHRQPLTQDGELTAKSLGTFSAKLERLEWIVFVVAPEPPWERL